MVKIHTVPEGYVIPENCNAKILSHDVSAVIRGTQGYWYTLVTDFVLLDRTPTGRSD